MQLSLPEEKEEAEGLHTCLLWWNKSTILPAEFLPRETL